MNPDAVNICKAPFPWFGGKRRAAALVWSRLGDCPNYIEPFAGSLAVLLARPFPVRTETVNDIDGFICNAWRALQLAPDEVAFWADYPVSELDLHARHGYLAGGKREFTEELRADPDCFNAQYAGWWLWGIGCWIGDNWCRVKTTDAPPDLYPCTGKGVHAGARVEVGRRPKLSRQMPTLGGTGELGGAPCGVHQSGKRAQLRAWFAQLQHRLRFTRVCCGDWTRIIGPTPLFGPGTPCGIFLDPPYSEEGRDKVYGEHETNCADAVGEWAREHGADRRLRIALCGYEGQYAMPGWDCVAWKAAGGYGNQRADGSNDNAKRERIWFSPGCLAAERPLLFSVTHDAGCRTPDIFPVHVRSGGTVP